MIRRSWLWKRITRKKAKPEAEPEAVTPPAPTKGKIIWSSDGKLRVGMGSKAHSSGVIVNNRVYSHSQNVMAEVSQGPRQHDTIEEALKHRHAGSEHPWLAKSIIHIEKPILDAHSHRMIEEFVGRHSGAKNAHKVMIIEDDDFGPSFHHASVEVALKHRHEPSFTLPKPSQGEIRSF